MALPNGYSRVKYLESTGTQYISLFDVTPDLSPKLKTVIDKEPTDFSVHNLDGCGWQGTPWVNSFYLGVLSGGSVGYGNGRYDVSPGVSYQQGRRVFTQDAPGGVVEISGLWKANYTALKPEQALPFLIFAYKQGNNTICGKERIYRATFYRNGAVFSDLIPCVNSSNVPGMYDVTQNTFFKNQGTGQFIAGPRVEKTNTVLVDGTVYEIGGGKVSVNSVQYTIPGGKANVSGVVYNLSLSEGPTPVEQLTLTLTGNGGQGGAVKINGGAYILPPKTVPIKKGDKVYVQVNPFEGKDCTIYLNGRQVAYQYGNANYTLTVNSDVMVRFASIYEAYITTQ